MQTPPRLPGNIPGVTFGGIALPSSDFQAVRDGRRAPMFYVDVDLSTARSFAAGTQLNLALAANFLYVDQRLNSGVAAIHFQDQNQGATPVTMFPGALWKIPFTQMGLENTAQAGQSIRLIYGVDIDALPISAAGVTILNPVSVIDGGKSRTINQDAFVGAAATSSALGQYAHVQLWNPAASGKKLIVEQIMPGGVGDHMSIMGPYNVILATAATTPTNKYIISGARATVALMRTESNAAQLISSYLAYVPVKGYQCDAVKLAEPIVISPGYGLNLVTNTWNDYQAFSVEYYEENV